MEEKTRLGRGLEEVSRFYLSERPREAAVQEPAPAGPHEGRRVVRVFHPCSSRAKSLFIANFALELARARLPVALWDGGGEEGADALHMLGGLVSQDPVPGALAVRLYGLPEILVHKPQSHTEEKLRSLARDASSPGGKGFLLISLPDTVESVIRSDTPFDAVMLCPLDEASLLKTYAFIKVIRESDPAGRLYVAFDGPPPEEAREMFSRLDGFMRERLLGPLSYLGALQHDESLERSDRERMPVVLGHGESAARDSLTAICGAFLQSSGTSGAGEP
jgi:hypothetical protein